MRKYRQLLFLRNVFLFTISAFGGAQAHIALFLKYFVQQQKLILESELLELYALSQVLPGPASTQTLVGIAYKVGGLRLALITFVIWILPSACIMIILGLCYNFIDHKERFIEIFRFIQPIAVGIVGFSGYSLAKSVLKTPLTIFLSIASVMAVFVLRNAYAFPLAILVGGFIASSIETSKEETQVRVNLFANINPKKFIYFVGLLLVFAFLGTIINKTSDFSLPIRLFENFYRNGIFIFGGGQVLVPLMYTEFVQMKHYLLPDEFLSGYAIQQVIPGPTFSFSSFLGVLSMKTEGYGLSGQILGGFIALLGINLPGLILILYIVPFWDDLKKITRIKNSLNGVNAVCVGFIVAAFYFLFQPVAHSSINVLLVLCSFATLVFSKISPVILIFIGIGMGLIASFF